MSRPTEHDVFRALKLWPGDVTKQESYLRMCVAMREPLAIHQPPAMLPDRQDAVAKGSQRSTGDNSTMTPRIFRVGEPDAQRDDGLSVTEIVGTVAKPPLTEREQRLQDMGNQIGRAVSGLSAHEPRLGAARFHPSPED